MRSLLTSCALTAFLTIPLALAGCDSQEGTSSTGGGGTGGAPDACQLAYVGDKDAPIEMEIVTLDPEYAAQPFTTGGDVSILFPPQGGRVLFVGVRATNLDPCAVRLAGAVRDLAATEPEQGQVRLDQRTVNLEEANDGWCESDPTDISTFSNIPVCPNSWAKADIFDQTFKLIVSVRDRNGKEAETELDLVPRCNETKSVDGVDLQKECLCMCQQGYVTGQMCQ